MGNGIGGGGGGPPVDGLIRVPDHQHRRLPPRLPAAGGGWRREEADEGVLRRVGVLRATRLRSEEQNAINPKLLGTCVQLGTCVRQGTRARRVAAHTLP